MREADKCDTISCSRPARVRARYLWAGQVVEVRLCEACYPWYKARRKWQRLERSRGREERSLAPLVAALDAAAARRLARDCPAQ